MGRPEGSGGWGPVHPRPPPHTHSTKLPMAARGLQETYRRRLRFSALRMARITLESEEAQTLSRGPRTPYLKEGRACWEWTSVLRPLRDHCPSSPAPHK